jgi:hypothetical protein
MVNINRRANTTTQMVCSLLPLQLGYRTVGIDSHLLVMMGVNLLQLILCL